MSARALMLGELMDISGYPRSSAATGSNRPIIGVEVRPASRPTTPDAVFTHVIAARSNVLVDGISIGNDMGDAPQLVTQSMVEGSAVALERRAIDLLRCGTRTATASPGNSPDCAANGQRHHRRYCIAYCSRYAPIKDHRQSPERTILSPGVTR